MTTIGSILRYRDSRFQPGRAIAMLMMMCALGLYPSLGHAQSDDETDEAPAKTIHKRVATIPYHRHGGGGVDDSRLAPTLRSDPHSLDRTRWDLPASQGLALDHPPLPGEMGPAPEPTKPLFDQSASGLATHPDLWEIPGKQ
jgi:hypothetical protein